MTKKEALEQCLKLWKALRDHPNFDDKELAVEETLGYFPLNDCPACEYAKTGIRPDCTKCPADAWRANGEDGFYACDIDISGQRDPGDYYFWCEAKSDEERELYAGNIVKLVEQSLENLK